MIVAYFYNMALADKGLDDIGSEATLNKKFLAAYPLPARRIECLLRLSPKSII